MGDVAERSWPPDLAGSNGAMDAIAIKHHYRAVDSVAKPRVHCVLSSLRLDFLPAEAAQTPGAAQRNTPRRVS